MKQLSRLNESLFIVLIDALFFIPVISIGIMSIFLKSEDKIGAGIMIIGYLTFFMVIFAISIGMLLGDVYIKNKAKLVGCLLIADIFNALFFTGTVVHDNAIVQAVALISFFVASGFGITSIVLFVKNYSGPSRAKFNESLINSAPN